MVMRARCATRSTAWQRVFGLMFLWSVMAHDQSGPSYAVQSGDICPAGGADIPGGHASSYGRAVIADHLALMYGRTQRVRELGRHCAGIHLWQVGPGHLACIVALVSDAPHPPSVYKARLVDIPELSHVTVEVEPCPGHHPHLRKVA